MEDHEAQKVLDRVKEALDTPDLANPYQRLVVIGMILNSLQPLTKWDIRQAEEIANGRLWD